MTDDTHNDSGDSHDDSQIETAPATAGDSVNGHGDRLDGDADARVATRARQLVRDRLRDQLLEHSDMDDDELLDRIADEEADRADGALLRIAIAQATADELGIEVGDAVDHPVAARAYARIRADAEPQRMQVPHAPALLFDAIHVFGIETLQPGDHDLELRLADAGIDVRKPSSGQTIGRLPWDEVEAVTVRRPRRSLPGRRRNAQLVAGTERGEVTFELPGLSDEEITEHLEPLISRNCERFGGAVSG